MYHTERLKIGRIITSEFDTLLWLFIKILLYVVTNACQDHRKTALILKVSMHNFIFSFIGLGIQLNGPIMLNSEIHQHSNIATSKQTYCRLFIYYKKS